VIERVIAALLISVMPLVIWASLAHAAPDVNDATTYASAISTSSDEETTNLVAQFGLKESVQRADERPGWQKPRKIIVRAEKFLSFPGIDWLQSVAPGVQFVVADSIEKAVAQAHDADAIIGWCDARILNAGPQIRWIQFLYAGVDSCVSIPALREQSVLLTNMQRVQSAIIAEHAIAMILALGRGIDLGVARQTTGQWLASPMVESGRLRVLKGKTLLIAGLGGIGSEVAVRAHALGMRVVATRASDRSRPEYVSHVGLSDELPKLVAEADVIVNALPLTETTKGVFDAQMFGVMRRSAFFINVGRGGTVVTSALVKALESGALAGAGLDVTDPEPLPSDHPLWRVPNIIITPHISSESELGFQNVWTIVRENLRRYVAGEKMLSVVDPVRGY
jgi:phosphoglycerate dehydrogenase-like enzyme